MVSKLLINVTERLHTMTGPMPSLLFSFEKEIFNPAQHHRMLTIPYGGRVLSDIEDALHVCYPNGFDIDFMKSTSLLLILCSKSRGAKVL